LATLTGAESAARRSWSVNEPLPPAAQGQPDNPRHDDEKLDRALVNIEPLERKTTSF
jgi:hypothetical protein